MEAPITIEAIDIEEIFKILPHRFPFLMIDRVINIRNDFSGVGIKNVTINEPQFAGHFPGRPIFPGVLMMEGMAQTAGVLCLRQMSSSEHHRAMYFLTIDKAKFRKPARPGDTLEYHVDKITQRRNMWWYRGEAKVDGVLVAEAELGAYLAEE